MLDWPSICHCGALSKKTKNNLSHIRISNYPTSVIVMRIAF